jgi:hypothetical protein
LLRNVGRFVFIVSILFVFIIPVDLIFLFFFLVVLVMNGDPIRN